MLEKQREYFKSGITLDINFRIKKLKLLKESIIDNIDELIKAFDKDYNKCEFDVYATEIGLVIKEINYFIKNLKKLAKAKKVRTSLINFPSTGYLISEPYGNVLVVSPWNYPFQLTMMPIIGAIAAGNTVYLKISRNVPSVGTVIKKILSIFEEEYIYVMENSKENMDNLFNLKFDYIFYTGSTNVAKDLMMRQAKYLTPMTLELGGKSPCIIDKDANIEKSVKRLVWGKYLNAGQTCVAPDYVLVHSDIKRDVIKYIIKYINEFYYDKGKLRTEFTGIVNERDIKRLLNLTYKNKLICGGNADGEKMEPTVLDDVSYDDEVMKEEIFGPILPIIQFNDLDDVINQLKNMDKPLALYYFGKNKRNQNKIIKNISFGGGCINDTIMHLSENKLPFGGVGLSGLGAYHGKKSFEIFTRQKSILKKHNKIEFNLKYPPYNNKKLKVTKFYFKIKKSQKN